MQTLKTAVVVVLLLFVIYGAFVAINGSNTSLNPEIANMVDLDTTTPDIGGVTGPFVASSPGMGTTSSPAASGAGADPWAQFNSKPVAGFNSAPPPLPSGSTLPNASNSSASASNTMPPLPPSLSPLDSASAFKSASSSTSTFDTSSLPPLPNLPPIVAKDGTNIDDTADLGTNKEKDLNGPSFGLAIPQTKDSLSESPTLAATSSLPSTLAPSSTLPTLPQPAASSATPRAPGKSYMNAKQVAMDQASKGQLKEALATMSVFYNSTELSSEQRTDLIDFLDALASEVIYSREHYLEIAHFTAPGETLEQIAKRYEVPTEVLARINGLDTTSQLQNGTKLKVIPGPFRAEVDLTRNELTLFLGELYASRFPISTGADPNPQPGVYSVVAKDRNRNYYGAGNPISANDPRNPYGGYWIDLGENVCIHGASDSNADKLGCISLSPGDVADVFGMLSSGSQVTIKR